MNYPKFSVVIPAYNQAKFIGETIKSVLNQTYPDFELIIVNDGSTDNTKEVIALYEDPRIRYIEFEKNTGEQAARNVGIRASNGNLIAHLDADDLYHPQKLEKHTEFLLNHPEIGLSYNARYNLHHSSSKIRDLWRPPREVGLPDLVLGYPFAPSDVVVRKELIEKVGFFDESYSFSGEELDMNCRLALEGCKFASVDKALNYRRYHTARIDKHLTERKQEIFRALNKVFSDPRCPPGVSALCKLLFSKFLLTYFFIAFAQKNYELGNQFLYESLELDPSILTDPPSDFIKFLINNSIKDFNVDHSTLLKNIFSNLPKEVALLTSKWTDWAIARGYLFKGTTAIIWGEYEKGEVFFSQAVKSKAVIDNEYLNKVSSDVLNFANEFGTKEAELLLMKLTSLIGMVGDPSKARNLRSLYSANKAFQDFGAERYDEVPYGVIKAFTQKPSFIFNKGLHSIVLTSLLRSLQNTKNH